MSASKWKHHKSFHGKFGEGPHNCWGCGKETESYWDGVKFVGVQERIAIHHFDFDSANNNPSNLRFMHLRCHTSLHHKGKLIGDEYRSKLSIAAKGRVITKETALKISMANTGKRLTNETKQKMGVAHSKIDRAQAEEIRNKYINAKYKHGLIRRLAVEYGVSQTPIIRCLKDIR
jgi:hypothetical protein